MIVLVLLAVASILAAIASAIRSAQVAQRRVSDNTILLIDFASAAIATILLIGAALAASYGDRLDGPQLVAGLLLTGAAAAATGSSVVRLVLAAGGIPTRSDNHDDAADDPELPPLRGGRIIGVLERLAVSACILLGWPAGIPVILGVKSLARFSELRAPHASEQFILGTFASVMWACAVSGIGYLLAA